MEAPDNFLLAQKICESCGGYRSAYQEKWRPCDQNIVEPYCTKLICSYCEIRYCGYCKDCYNDYLENL